jgi:hypothetical protein
MDPKERIRAVENLTDQTLLAKVAIDEDNGFPDRAGAKDVGCAAVCRLSDQALLAKVAIECRGSDGIALAAVGNLTDRTVLAKVASEARRPDARRAAFDQLAAFKRTDQANLAMVALEGQTWDSRLAVDKLTDQAILAKVALNRGGGVAAAAVEKLTDEALLAKVAVDANDDSARYPAYCRLCNSRTIAKLSAAADPTTRLYASALLKIHAACQPIPEEHKARLVCKVLTILQLLWDPLVTAELGDVKDINVAWESRSESYYNYGYVWGEWFMVSVKLSKTDQVVSRGWITDFPSALWARDRHFLEAPMPTSDFAEDICGLLSASTRAAVAIKSKRYDLRLAAIENLTDQTVLAKVAAQDKDDGVGRRATARLAELRRNNPGHP